MHRVSLLDQGEANSEKYKQYIAYYGNVPDTYTYQKVDFNDLRKAPWLVSRLRTYKCKLFKEFINQDPNADNLKPPMQTNIFITLQI